MPATDGDGPLIYRGPTASMPAVGAVEPGDMFYDTTTGLLVQSNGDSWCPVSAAVPTQQHLYGNGVTGIESVTRDNAGILVNIGAGSSGQMGLYYTTAQAAVTVANMRWCLGSTAAGATPSVSRWGIYEIAANGNGTLVASTANDPALFTSGTFAMGSKPLSASLTLKAGQRYAFGGLVVTGAAMPNFYGAVLTAGTAVSALAPRHTGYIGSLSDLPASFAAGDVSNYFAAVWCAATP